MRRPQPSEYDSVRALIETVANETFSDLFAPNPVPLKFEDEDWPLAWVAVSDEKIVGVIITNQEWISDLWVCREHRRQGIGSKLLAQGEVEIAARGHQTCRLRVVRSNAVAVQFYLSQGWQIAREFEHEKYHHAMLEMLKSLPESSSTLSERMVGNRQVRHTCHNISDGTRSISNLTDGVIQLSPLTQADAAAHLAGEDEEMAKWLSGGCSTAATVQTAIDKFQLMGFVEANLEILGNPEEVNVSYGISPHGEDGDSPGVPSISWPNIFAAPFKLTSIRKRATS